jgi:hypothetical protein
MHAVGSLLFRNIFEKIKKISKIKKKFFTNENNPCIIKPLFFI